MSEVEEERLVAGVIDDLDRFISETIGQVFARFAELEMRHVAKLGAEPARAAVGPPEGLRRTPVRAADVHVEAMGLGEVIRIAQMPLADERGEIARVLQMLRERRLRVRKIVQRVALQ